MRGHDPVLVRLCHLLAPGLGWTSEITGGTELAGIRNPIDENSEITVGTESLRPAVPLPFGVSTIALLG